MAAELGDTLAGPQLVVTEDSAGENVSAGDTVEIDGNNELVKTVNNSDLFGVVLGATRAGVDLSSLSQGDPVSVLIFGGVVANANPNVTQGDVLGASSTVRGRLVPIGTGTEKTIDEGGGDTYTIGNATALAISDAGGTTPAGESLSATAAAIFVGR